MLNERDDAIEYNAKPQTNGNRALPIVESRSIPSFDIYAPAQSVLSRIRISADIAYRCRRFHFPRSLPEHFFDKVRLPRFGNGGC